MKIHFIIPKELRAHFNKEMICYKNALMKKDLRTAWRHLERAHILGQAWPVEHTMAHWEMLKFGFRIKSGKEILGQIPRLAAGGIKSFVGEIPVGNTGGANVPPLMSMPVPDDLAAMLNAVK